MDIQNFKWVGKIYLALWEVGGGKCLEMVRVI